MLLVRHIDIVVAVKILPCLALSFLSQPVMRGVSQGKPLFYASLLDTYN